MCIKKKKKKGSTAVDKNTREGRDFCKRKTSKEPTKSRIKPHDTEDTKGVIRSCKSKAFILLHVYSQ
jgi:hypothetical protein